MKIQHLLEAPSKLQAFISKNSGHFQQFGDVYVFLWTDDVLAMLTRMGAKTSDEFDGVQVPNELGLGLVNAVTGEICVGAIDSDYDALWAASQDVSDFFVNTKNRKLIRLPNRLQNLADMLKQAADPAQAGGVDAIVDYIDEYGIETVDVQAIKNMETTDEVRQYLEDLRDEAQGALDEVKEKQSELVAKAKKLLAAGDKDGARALSSQSREIRGNNGYIVKDAEDILKQKHLFTDQEATDTSEVDDNINTWTQNFLRDFPDLDLGDAREFAPQ